MELEGILYHGRAQLKLKDLNEINQDLCIYHF